MRYLIALLLVGCTTENPEFAESLKATDGGGSDSAHSCGGLDEPCCAVFVCRDSEINGWPVRCLNLQLPDGSKKQACEDCGYANGGACAEFGGSGWYCQEGLVLGPPLRPEIPQWLSCQFPPSD